MFVEYHGFALALADLGEEACVNAMSWPTGKGRWKKIVPYAVLPVGLSHVMCSDRSSIEFVF